MSDDALPRPEEDPDSSTPPGGPDHRDEHHGRFHDRLEEWEEAAIYAEMVTGHHEETVEDAKKSLVRRAARFVAGVFLTLLGIALLVLPGPGILCMVAGLALIAPEVPFADRWMQRLRKRLPEGEEGELSKGFLVVSIATAVVLLSISGYVSWMKFTNDSWDLPWVPLV